MVVVAAGDFTAVAEVEDSAGAGDFLVDMGLAAAEPFAVEAAGSLVAERFAVVRAGVHFVVAATSDVVTAVSAAAGTDEDGAGMDTVSA